MNPLRCLIVDDESLARRLLQDYLDKIPEAELVGSCQNALQVRQVLREESVDILFLDIQMPDLSGLDFLKTLQNPPLTILTTAYSEYALTAYELQVVDYLLKPFPFERFLQAFENAQELHRLRKQSCSKSEHTLWAERDYIFVKADHRIVKVRFTDIFYIEGLREYVRIHTPEEKVITLLSLQRLMDTLPAADFFRIHRSYIIRLDKIREVQGNAVVVGDTTLTVSKRQRPAFREWLETNGLF